MCRAGRDVGVRRRARRHRPAAARRRTPWPSIADLAGEIIDAFDNLPGLVSLVLDNVDELAAPGEAQDALRALLRHRPRGLRLVLASRLDPPLSLPRLRLEGRLHEIRVDRLGFSPIEAGELLEAAGVHLDEAQIMALHTLTGGWAAALRLAAISLGTRQTPIPFSRPSRVTSVRWPNTSGQNLSSLRPRSASS